MKVIIVEVTRAANSFGALHLDKIREAYTGIAGIVESAREEGSFKSGIPAEFAAMCFYGAIEQLLTGLDLRGAAANRRGVRPRQGARGRGDLRRAGVGAERRRFGVCLNQPPMQNDLTKRLMWSGLLAGVGALTSIVANRIATEIWTRVFKEDPPID